MAFVPVKLALKGVSPSGSDILPEYKVVPATAELELNLGDCWENDAVGTLLPSTETDILLVVRVLKVFLNEIVESIVAPLWVTEPLKLTPNDNTPVELLIVKAAFDDVNAPAWFDPKSAWVEPYKVVFIEVPLVSDSTILAAVTLSDIVAGVSLVIGIVIVAGADAVLNESSTFTVYKYSSIKSEFKNTPFFLVTAPFDAIENGFSWGSVVCEVPP